VRGRGTVRDGQIAAAASVIDTKRQGWEQGATTQGIKEKPVSSVIALGDP